MPNPDRLPLLLVLLLTSCTPSLGAPVSQSPAAFITSTLPATPMPPTTEIAATATLAATPSALSGSTTTQVNIRAEPASTSEVLGMLPTSARVQVIGRDPNGNWYEILLETPGAGTGWVSAAYVNLPDKDAVPLAPSLNELTASAREQINVRAGPGTDFESLGTLNRGDAVALTGKDQSGAWMQVSFAAGADGKGWVAASFLDLPLIAALPVVSESGEVLGTPTPAISAPAPSTTVPEAREDGDSENQPAVKVQFSPLGVGSVSVVGDLSAPQGDPSDWIQITPYYPIVEVALGCTGNLPVSVELLVSGTPWTRGQAPACGETRLIEFDAGTTYVLHLEVAAASGAPGYVQYRVGINGALPP